MLFMSLNEIFFFLVFTNRLFAMTITRSTPNTAYVRCSETELSLHLENGYMQLRPMKKYGNMICNCCLFLRIAQDKNDSINECEI